ncbi:MAG: glucoamylase family protein [Pseudomonadota bacterium]
MKPSFNTALNPGRPPKRISDDALLDAVARAALAFVWDFAHPASGMVRERSAGAFGYDIHQVVTTGGTGFGIMALLSGAARGWLRREDVAERVYQVCQFLLSAKRHSGVFPHFMDGETGATIPFMPTDDGGDLVETAFLVAGLLAARQAFIDRDEIVAAVDAICGTVEWDAHLRAADSALMWHRSARHPWTDKSLPIRGWNEALLVYVLATGAANHAIPAQVYHQCWATAEEFVNGRDHYGIRLPLGPDGGGPMFLSHYSFLGIDPTGLRDRYADYGEQVRAHAAINRAHCIENPHGFDGYDEVCWGLSASDSPGGYAAHSPTNDLGVITPTAAVASIPFLPDASLAALRHFVDDRGGTLWGPYGLADAFVPGGDWVAPGTLAIDQAPIVVMIENYRSGLLWDLSMSAAQVQRGLAGLGFTSPRLTIG